MTKTLARSVGAQTLRPLLLTREEFEAGQLVGQRCAVENVGRLPGPFSDRYGRERAAGRVGYTITSGDTVIAWFVGGSWQVPEIRWSGSVLTHFTLVKRALELA